MACLERVPPTANERQGIERKIARRFTSERIVVTVTGRHLLGSVYDLSDIGTAAADPHDCFGDASAQGYPIEVRTAVGTGGGNTVKGPRR